MMYRFLSCIFALLFISCNDRFVRKEINNNDITVSWYYYSYISDNSPDYVTVKKGNEERELYKAVDVITNVSIIKDTIVISTFEPYRGIIYTDTPRSEIWGYQIKIDTTASYKSYTDIPRGLNRVMLKKCNLIIIEMNSEHTYSGTGIYYGYFGTSTLKFKAF